VGVDGVAVGTVVAGGVLVWSGLKGASVLASLQSIIQGHKPTGENTHPIGTPTAGGSSTPGVPGAAVSGTALQNAVVAFAQAQIGIQYQFGGGNGEKPTAGTNSAGNGRPGWDCSGLTMAAWYVGSNHAVKLAHYVPLQYAACKKIDKASLQPGDIVFFDALGHCGLFIGNDQFIEAAHTGTLVRVSKLSARGLFVGGGRPG
jgi:cell wall-associated NlpC family hydrolase